MFPTLNRKSLEEGWGFSLIGGVDYLEAAGQFSGIVTRKGETGLWLKVRKSTKNLCMNFIFIYKCFNSDIGLLYCNV